jgi:hypothetical protein
LESVQIKKTIFVPDRVINFIIWLIMFYMLI